MTDHSQTKVDADKLDVAELVRKIAIAHSAKIPVLSKIKWSGARSCRSGKPNTSDQDASAACASVWDYSEVPDKATREGILLKGCSYAHAGNPAWNACLVLAQYYVDAGRNIEALAALKIPNAISVDRPDESNARIAGIGYAAYKALGNTEMARNELRDLCYNYGGGGAYTGGGSYASRSCGLLQRLGEPVDTAAANQASQEWEAERKSEKRQRAADEAEEKAEKAQRHQEIVALVGGLADTAVSSYGDYQAGVAQARVNVAVAQMEQQNRARGGSGYPTTSSSSGGSSSTSNSSSTSSKKPAETSSDTTDTSNSSDVSSDSSSGSSSTAANSDRPFNPYSSTGGGYNAYSGQGVPAAGSTIPGEKGNWIEEEYIVTYVSISVRHANINLSLVNGAGQMDEHGAYVKFENPDKEHRVYYGFSGVVNEMIEAGSTQARSWSAPYLYVDRPDPAFQARVTIRYFAIY